MDSDRGVARGVGGRVISGSTPKAMAVNRTTAGAISGVSPGGTPGATPAATARNPDIARIRAGMNRGGLGPSSTDLIAAGVSMPVTERSDPMPTHPGTTAPTARSRAETKRSYGPVYVSGMEDASSRNELHMLEDDKLAMWLQDTKASILQTDEWKNLSKRVFTRLEKYLAENHMVFFSELSDAEKILFINQVEQDLADDPASQAVATLVGRAVDEHLQKSVAATVDESHTGDSATKTDLLLSYSSYGAAALLRKWPDQRSKLSALVNQRVRQPLQAEVWRLYLVDPAGRREYENKLHQNRVETISPVDHEITQKCQDLLASEFPELSGNLTQLTTMKTVLSYMHATFGFVDPNFYYLMVPLITVFRKSVSVPAILEHALALYRTRRPRFIVEASRALDREASSLFATRLDEIISREDPVLSRALYSAVADTRAGPEGVASLVANAVERIFVGCVNLPTALYIWDSCIVGTFDILIYFCATMLILLRTGLLTCRTAGAAQRVITDQARQLHYTQFQKEMQIRFMRKIRESSVYDDGGAKVPTATASFVPQSNVNYDAIRKKRAADREKTDEDDFDTEALLAAYEQSQPNSARTVQGGAAPVVASAVPRALGGSNTGGNNSPALKNKSGPGSAVPTSQPTPTQSAAQSGKATKRKPVLALRLNQLMKKWRASRWVILWVKHKPGSLRKLPVGTMASIARVGGASGCVLANGPILLNQLTVVIPPHITELPPRVDLVVPPIFMYADRLSDVLDRIGSSPDNAGNVPENTLFGSHLQRAVQSLLPLLEDDTGANILRLRVPQHQCFLYLKPLEPGEDARPVVSVALRREGLSDELAPKVMKALIRHSERTIAGSGALTSSARQNSGTLSRDGSFAAPVNNDKAIKSLVILAKRFMGSVQMVGGGTAEENQETRMRIMERQQKRDVALTKAQKDKYGRVISDENIANMTDEERRKYEKTIAPLMDKFELQLAAEEQKELEIIKANRASQPPS